ncbi:MAG: ABC transporter permease [Acidobacteriota bacterium]
MHNRGQWFRKVIGVHTDLRSALRSFRRSPAFAASAVACLALGIGANTAIFSLLDQVLLRSLPVSDPERLVMFHHEGQDPGSASADNYEAVYSYPTYKAMRDRNTVFSGVIARAGGAATVTEPSGASRAGVDMVTGNFFETLGVRAALGRVLTPSDDVVPGGHPVAVLSYGYWQSHFGGDPAALNRKILVNGNPFTIIGVADQRFRGVLSGRSPDLFVPVTMLRQIHPEWNYLDDFTARWMNVMARLKPGVTRARAGAAAQALFKTIREEDLPRVRRMGERERAEYLARRLELRPASQGINQLRRMWEKPLVVVMAMVGLVLLIACANVGNLFIARAAGRRREIAIRLAIGAGRLALLRQMLVESVLLSLAGGLAGLVAARWTAAALLRILPEDATEGWVAAGADLRVLGFTLAVALAAGIVFGCAPLFQIWTLKLGPTLKDQATAVLSGTGRFRRALVAGQAALALVLLAGAGLFVRSLQNLAATDPGFRPRNLLVFAVMPELSGYDAARGALLERNLRERLARMPGVEAVSTAALGPFGNGRSGASIAVEGYQARPDEDPGAELDSVGAGFFRTLGIPLAAGREFTDRDDRAAPTVAVINEAFAKKYFRGRNPLGMHVGQRKPEAEIVGVVRDIKYGDLREHPGPFLYVSYPRAGNMYRMVVYVRGQGASLAQGARQAVREIDANLPVTDMRTMQVRIEESIQTDRLIALLAGAFGLLALALAAVGLYGVIAYSVARRTAEIGIRVALGAGRRNVLWLVMREVALLVGSGILIGLPVALALGRVVESQLFGIRAHDPAMFAAAAAALAGAGLLAGYLPARRALAIDPMRALKYE